MNPFTAHDRRLPDDNRTDDEIEEDSFRPAPIVAYEYDAKLWAKVVAKTSAQRVHGAARKAPVLFTVSGT